MDLSNQVEDTGVADTGKPVASMDWGKEKHMGIDMGNVGMVGIPQKFVGVVGIPQKFGVVGMADLGVDNHKDMEVQNHIYYP